MIPALAWVIGAVVSAVVVVAGAVFKAAVDDCGWRQHGLCQSLPDRRDGRDAGTSTTDLPGPLPGPGAGSGQGTGTRTPVPGTQGWIPGAVSRPSAVGKLELKLHRRADLKYLVYLLVYRPADPTDANEAIYVHHGRTDARGVEVLAPEQIAEQARRLGWSADILPRLCARGTRLSAAQPACTAVVRVRPDLAANVTSQGEVRYFATPLAALAASGDDGNLELQPATVQAQTMVALKNVMFVTLRQPRIPPFGIAREMVYRVERGGGLDPSVRKFAIPWDAEQPWGSRADRIELSRDGSRVYLSARREVREWTGEGAFRQILELADGNPGSALAGLAVTDHGVCAMMKRWCGYLEHPAPEYGLDGIGIWRMRLVCKGQHVDHWNAPIVLNLPPRIESDHQFRTVDEPYELASAADSMMIVYPYPLADGQLDAAFVADTLSPFATGPRVPLYQQPLQGRPLTARSVLAWSGDGAGSTSPIQYYLLSGILPDPQSPVDASMALLRVLPRGPVASSQFSPPVVLRPQQPGDPLVASGADALRMGRIPGSSALIALVQYQYASRRVRVIDYSPRLGRPIASRSFRLLGGWEDGRAVQVLSDPSGAAPGAVVLALSGVRVQPTMKSPVLWLQPLSLADRGGALVAPLRFVDFGQEALLLVQRAHAPDVRVSSATRDTSMLVPVEPQA